MHEILYISEAKSLSPLLVGIFMRITVYIRYFITIYIVDHLPYMNYISSSYLLCTQTSVFRNMSVPCYLLSILQICIFSLSLSATIKALQGMNQPIPKTMHRGHIPGSKNVLESQFINPNTNCFLPPDEIIKGNFDCSCSIIFSCSSSQGRCTW